MWNKRRLKGEREKEEEYKRCIGNGSSHWNWTLSSFNMNHSMVETMNESITIYYTLNDLTHHQNRTSYSEEESEKRRIKNLELSSITFLFGYSIQRTCNSKSNVEALVVEWLEKVILYSKNVIFCISYYEMKDIHGSMTISWPFRSIQTELSELWIDLLVKN